MPRPSNHLTKEGYKQEKKINSSPSKPGYLNPSASRAIPTLTIASRVYQMIHALSLKALTCHLRVTTRASDYRIYSILQSIMR